MNTEETFLVVVHQATKLGLSVHEQKTEYMVHPEKEFKNKLKLLKKLNIWIHF